MKLNKASACRTAVALFCSKDLDLCSSLGKKIFDMHSCLMRRKRKNKKAEKITTWVEMILRKKYILNFILDRSFLKNLLGCNDYILEKGGLQFSNCITIWLARISLGWASNLSREVIGDEKTKQEYNTVFQHQKHVLVSVSYTHLTLPTKRIV